MGVVEPAKAQSDDERGSIPGGAFYGALSGAFIGLSVVTIQANTLDDYTGGFGEVKGRLQWWVVVGAAVSGLRMGLTKGASASHMARETFYTGAFGLASGLAVGAIPFWGLPNQNDRAAGAIIGLGAALAVAAGRLLYDPKDDINAWRTGASSAAPLVLLRWTF